MPVAERILSFPASPSPDVVGYNLYVAEAPAVVDYDSEKFDLGNVTTVDLATISGFTTKDGTYNLGVSAYDAAGNESSLSTIDDVVMDFVAPDPPGQITIT